MALRAGAILAVTDVDRSVAFYRDRIGFEVEALYDDPPYATLTLAGARLSLAGERGADVYFSHDMDAWRGYKHAPDFYEL